MNLLVQQIIDAVSAWEGITPEPHRFGGTEFSLGKVEIGHIHHSGMVDIPFTKKLHNALIADGQAEQHHFVQDSGWISFYLRKPDDTAQALRLIRLSYLHKRSRRQRDLDVTSELAQLAFAQSVVAAFGSRADLQDGDGS
jgi:hypothetical protein